LRHFFRAAIVARIALIAISVMITKAKMAASSCYGAPAVGSAFAEYQTNRDPSGGAEAIL
jgi:hypothetical protein